MDGVTSTKTECGAQLRKKPGVYCRKPPMPNGRCRNHGGRSLKGAAHGNYGGKGYSEYAPDSLRSLIEHSLEDKKLLNMTDEIRVFVGRFKQLLTQIDRGESGETWRACQSEMANYREAMRVGDREMMAEHLSQLNKLINHGVGQAMVWDELGRTADRVQRLTDSEEKRKIQRGQVMHLEDLMMFADDVVLAVRESITDAEPDDKIQAAIFSNFCERFAGILGIKDTRGGGRTFEPSALPAISE